ncbi:hypothetical protein PENSPDRAFT_206864 [Peniophora sp. CONT]|nr:hypothetical protein PENSPDRAFT_206864 [Peniophora sp. CONT]
MPSRRSSVNPLPSRVTTPARALASRAPEFLDAGGPDSQTDFDANSPPPPARAAPSTQAPASAFRGYRSPQPVAQGATASGSQVQHASTARHGPQPEDAATPGPNEGFVTPQNLSPAPTIQRRTPRQVERAMPPPVQSQVHAQTPKYKPKPKAPSQAAGSSSRVVKPVRTLSKGRDRLDAKNFFFLLEEQQGILTL